MTSSPPQAAVIFPFVMLYFSNVFNNHDSMNDTGELTPVCLLILWVSCGGGSGGYYVVICSSELDN